MLNWLKLSQRSHSGRLRPHEHTSYLPLGLILLVVGIVLSAYTAYAATPYDGPDSKSLSLSGIMPGSAPTVAATIKTPTDQQHFSTVPIEVSGTCPDNTLVELYKNNIFAGSTPCTDANIYSIDIDLMIGKNVLVAKVYDALNQPGPDSNLVTVYYDALPAQSSPLTSNASNTQLLLNTDAVYRGIFPKQELKMPIDIMGGTSPYAINIQWGDSTNKVIPRSNSGSFTASHTYNKAGTYKITIQATDAAGNVAFLTVTAIVNGQPSVATTIDNSNTTSTTSKLLFLWPLYAAAAAVVTSFYLGEQREKHVLRKHGLLLDTPIQ